MDNKDFIGLGKDIIYDNCAENMCIQDGHPNGLRTVVIIQNKKRAKNEIYTL